MRGVVMYGPGDVRVEQRAKPTIIAPTDAVLRLSATCVCGSDLWPYRGTDEVSKPTPMGHEYVGVVEEVGSAVTTVTPGQFVVGSFAASDNTCPICRAGYQSSCERREWPGAGGAQAEYLRVPLADGTLVATPELPSEDLVPSLLAASDVLGTGWFGAVAAEVGPGKTRRGGRRRGGRAARRPGRRRSWGRSGSSRCPGTPTGRSWRSSSVPPTSSSNVATRGWPRSRS